MSFGSLAYTTGQTRRLQRLRPKLAGRQRWRCHWCKSKVKLYKDNSVYRPDEATIDHRIHRADGGDDSEENIVVSCRICNQVRSGMNPPEKFRHLIPSSALIQDPAWFKPGDPPDRSDPDASPDPEK